MPHRVRLALALAAAVIVGAIPCSYAVRQKTSYRNFRAVEDGVLYRSGQLPPDAFDRVIREYQIRTVVSLRDSYTDGPPPDLAEQRYCEANGIRHVRISPEPWSAPDGRVPAADGVRAFVRLMDDRDRLKPVLVHCFAGIHRTGAHVAVYRMEFQGWSDDDAVAEMVAVEPRRSQFEQDLLGFLRSYRPRSAADRSAGR
jgi:protein tyrosine/serine phosphatase